MQRRWIGSIAAALLVAGALYLLLAGGPAEEDREYAEPWQTGPGADPGQPGDPEDTPTLEAGSRPGDATSGPRGEGSGGAPPAARPGPAEVLVISAETELPLENVVLKAGEKELGASDEDGLVRLASVPPEGIPFVAVLAGHLPATAKVVPLKPLEVVLHPGIPVSGRVVQGSSRDDPGEAGILVWDEDLDTEIASFATDESGRFEIPGVRPHRPFVVTVRLAGFVPHVERFVLDVPTDDLLLVVGEGGYLTGRVQTQEGAPLLGVAVRLVHAGEPLLEHRVRAPGESRAYAGRIAARTATTRTDEAGRYVFDGVDVGTNFQPVVVLGPRHIVRAAPVEFEETGQTIERDVSVPDAASLEIRVEDAAGTTIGDADLVLHWWGGRWLVRPGDERVKGEIVLADLTPGPVRIVATRPGTPTRETKVTLRAGEATSAKITFPRSTGLHGTVTDKRGKPIWKARVVWQSEGETVEVRSEMDGRFAFQRLEQPTGTVLVSARDLSVSQFAYEGRKIQGVEAAGPPLHVVLKDGTRVTGSFPELPAGQRVFAEMYPGTKHDAGFLHVDEEQHFARRGPPPGRGALFVFKTRGLPPLLHKEPFKFASEEVRELGPLVFEQTNPRRGRVLGDDGLPIWAAKVSVEARWSKATARTDRSGDFLLARMPREPFFIRVEAEGYPSNRLRLWPKSEFRPEIIHLVRTVKARLRVVNRDMRSAGKATVILRPLFDPPDGGAREPVELTTNRGGFAKVTLTPGRYEARATASGGRKGKKTIEFLARRPTEAYVVVR